MCGLFWCNMGFILCSIVVPPWQNDFLKLFQDIMIHIISYHQLMSSKKIWYHLKIDLEMWRALGFRGSPCGLRTLFSTTQLGTATKEGNWGLLFRCPFERTFVKVVFGLVKSCKMLPRLTTGATWLYWRRRSTWASAGWGNKQIRNNLFNNAWSIVILFEKFDKRKTYPDMDL